MRKQKIHEGGGREGETHSGAEAQDRVECNSHEVTYLVESMDEKEKCEMFVCGSE